MAEEMIKCIVDVGDPYRQAPDIPSVVANSDGQLIAHAVSATYMIC